MSLRVEKRDVRRWNHKDLVTFRAAKTGGEGRLGNVSEGGVFVHADGVPEPGEAVQISFWGLGAEVQLHAVVRWNAHREDGPEGFGAELVAPPHEYIELVHSIAQIEIARAMARPGPHRGAPRVSLSVPVGIDFDEVYDSGTLHDLSATGARLEGARMQPPLGRSVLLTFWLGQNTSAFEVVGRVVRHTESAGYAVEFEEVEPELKTALRELYDLALRDSA